MSTQMLVVLFVLSTLSSLVFLFVLVLLPADFFEKSSTSRLRYAIGILCLIGGGIMIVTPGPGILTILLGLTFFPFFQKSKRLHEKLKDSRALHFVNRLRERLGRAPFVF